MAEFFKLAGRRAELNQRKQETDADRQLKLMQIGKESELRQRALDMEDARLQAEANRWFASNDIAKRQVAVLEKDVEGKYNPNLLPGRTAGDLATINANVAERNARAQAAAKRANAILPALEEKLSRDLNTFRFGFGRSDAEAASMAKTEVIPQVFAQLGPDAELVSFDQTSRQFTPIEIQAPSFGARSTAPSAPATAPSFQFTVPRDFSPMKLIWDPASSSFK